MLNKIKLSTIPDFCEIIMKNYTISISVVRNEWHKSLQNQCLIQILRWLYVCVCWSTILNVYNSDELHSSFDGFTQCIYFETWSLQAEESIKMMCMVHGEEIHCRWDCILYFKHWTKNWNGLTAHFLIFLGGLRGSLK